MKRGFVLFAEFLHKRYMDLINLCTICGHAGIGIQGSLKNFCHMTMWVQVPLTVLVGIAQLVERKKKAKNMT